MTKNKTPHTIHAALKKLKDDSNAKEVELIELVASIYEAAKETQERSVEKVHDMKTAVNKSVHSHPWHYIGGAVFCGFLAGLFIRR